MELIKFNNKIPENMQPLVTTYLKPKNDTTFSFNNLLVTLCMIKLNNASDCMMPIPDPS